MNENTPNETPEEVVREPRPNALLERMRHPTAVLILALTAISTGLILLLWRIRLDETAMLYVGLPYLITVALLVFSQHRQRLPGLRATYSWVLRTSLLIFFATSVMLREGFICVLFFLPIYVFIVSLVFGLIRLAQRFRAPRDRLSATAIPLVLLAMSAVEGVSPAVTLSTEGVVSASGLIAAAPGQVRERLRNPSRIDGSRDLLLALFPMPYALETGSLDTGAEHRAHYRYHRWLVTNTHEGTTTLRITESTSTRLVAEVVSDDSYLAKYLSVREVRLRLEPQSEALTRVTLTVRFDRKLSPAWYFAPLEREAVRLMAAHFIEEVLRDA